MVVRKEKISIPQFFKLTRIAVVEIVEGKVPVSE
jgi:hypothetical protein